MAVADQRRIMLGHGGTDTDLAAVQHIGQGAAALHMAAQQVLLARHHQQAARRGPDLELCQPLVHPVHLVGHPQHLLLQVQRPRVVAQQQLEALGAQLRHVTGQPRLLRQQLRVRQRQQQLARTHLAAVGGRKGLDKTVGLGPHPGLVWQPHHTPGGGMKRQRQHKHHGAGQCGQTRQHAARAPATLRRTTGTQHRLYRARQRQQQHHAQAVQRDHHTQRQRMVTQPQHDHAGQEDPVTQRQRCIGGKPFALTRRQLHGSDTPAANKRPLQQHQPVTPAACAEVGQVQRVTQDVITVEVQQRVGIKQQRRHTGHKHGDKSQVAQQPGLQVEPQQQGQCGQRQLHHDAHGSYRCALVALAKAGRGRGVHIGHRSQHKQANAGLVHLATPVAYRQRMPEFMQRLDAGKRQPGQKQVLRRGHGDGGVAGEATPVHRRHQQRQHHTEQPEPEDGRAKQQSAQPVQVLQQGCRVAQRHPKRQRVHVRAPSP